MSSQPQPQVFRTTDSPWFWALLFSTMALVGIGLVARKFDVRQRQIEGRFLGRQRAAMERSRRVAGLPPVDLADDADDAEDREAVARGRIVPLWTLATLAGVAAAGSTVMLVRERRRAGAGAGPDRPVSR